MSHRRTSLELHSVNLDRTPADAPQTDWNNARNVIFRNQESVRVPGDTLTLPGITDTVLALQYFENDGIGKWLAATGTHVWIASAASLIDVTPDGWAASAGDTLTTCTINGIPVINHWALGPYWWDFDDDNVMQLLPDWPDGRTCIAMRAHKGFLFAIGMRDTGGNEVLWSDAAEPGTLPGTWTPGPDNLAGSTVLAPFFDECLDGASMRDEFFVYKRKSVWAAQFTGGAFIFSFRQVFAEHGLAATGALCKGPNDEHLFAAAVGDVYLTDGVRIESVLEGRAQLAFYNDFSADENPRILAASLQREKLGFIFYPVAGEQIARQALVFDFVSTDIGFRDCPPVYAVGEGRLLRDPGDKATWDGAIGTWIEADDPWNVTFAARSNDDILVGYDAGIVCITDPNALDFITGPVNAIVEKLGMSLGNPQTVKQVVALWPKIVGRTGDVLQFRMFGQSNDGAPVAQTPSINYVIGQNEPVHGFITGRFIGLRVQSAANVAPWRMGTVDIEYREVGKW